VLALWNYAAPGQTGSPKTFSLTVKGTNAGHALISRVDASHGDVHSAYEKMGAPRFPSQKQIHELRKSADLPATETRLLKSGELSLTLPAHGLAVIELK
jgi:beta-xylosidase